MYIKFENGLKTVTLLYQLYFLFVENYFFDFNLYLKRLFNLFI